MSVIYRPAEHRSNVDIQSIVRRVVDELNRRQSSPGTKKTGHPTEAKQLAETGRDDAFIGKRVITLADLEDISLATKKINVAPGTVLTPSVRDELRYRGIVLSRGADRQSATATPAPGHHRESTCYLLLQHDHTSGPFGDSGSLLQAARNLLGHRGVKHCGQAGKSIVLSYRPALALQESIQQGCASALISRIVDVDRFHGEISPSCYVMDLQHLNLMSTVNAIARIAQLTSRSTA